LSDFEPPLISPLYSLYFDEFARRIFVVPGAYHDVFVESAIKRNACIKATIQFFGQDEDDVADVIPQEPLHPYDDTQPIFTLTEVILRSFGAIVGAVGVAVGVTMMIGGRHS